MKNTLTETDQAAEKEFPFSEVCGAIHIHTCCSDGEVDFSELVAAAKEVELDYIVVTDHMTLEGKDKHFEGMYDNLLLLVGYEHNDSQNKNHYLAIGTDTVIGEQDSVQGYVTAIKNAGGIGFLAHPAEKRRYFKQYPSFPWTAWDVTGYDGIELWNHMSEWVENLKNVRSFIRVFYPRRFLKGVPWGLLKRWDEINRLRFVSGIGGIDAHTFHIQRGIFKLQIFPIKVALKGIRTHLYLPDGFAGNSFDTARKAFMEALRDGKGFFSNFRRGDARGTVVYLRYADGTVILPGRSAGVPSFPAILSIVLPAYAEVRLIRNSRLAEKRSGMHLNFEVTENGLYRIEVFRRKKAWIYTNPFPVGSYPLY